MSKKFSPENMHEELKRLTNAAGLPLVDDNCSQEEKVQLLPDKSVSTGKFRPHKAVAGCFYAHPTTIAAIRNDLFVVGEGLEDFELLHRCEGCREVVDVQFWKFCPHCAHSFPSDYEHKDFRLMPWEKLKG